MAKIIPQRYPRIQDSSSPYHGCLDDSTLVPHFQQITPEHMKALIISAVENANTKSSRAILSIPENVTDDELERIYRKEGRELFRYFRKYPGDPAATAHQLEGRHYREVGKEQFRNRTLQKERMNSGWRYQFLIVDCARDSGRFKSVSDLGAAEADFNAVIEFIDRSNEPLSLYVSVKNRRNTLGGQDWPKAIHALEAMARNDKNRTGPYCCVFGIAMDKGTRYIKEDQRTKRPHSDNTEVWLSDYLWPFFANYSYQEIMTLMLDVLRETARPDDLSTQIAVPELLLDAFGEACSKAGLIDKTGHFIDPYKLVEFFVS